MSFDGYDSWRTTPPDETHNEYAEEDAMEREHVDAMETLKELLESFTGQQLKLAGRMLDSERTRRLNHHAAELRELGAQLAAGEKSPRAPNSKPRSDKGKPRGAKLPANDTMQPDPDPFEQPLITSLADVVKSEVAR
jgi:hypothetical protein